METAPPQVREWEPGDAPALARLREEPEAASALYREAGVERELRTLESPLTKEATE